MYVYIKSGSQLALKVKELSSKPVSHHLNAIENPDIIN